MSGSTSKPNNEGCEEFEVDTQALIPADEDLAWKGYNMPVGLPSHLGCKWLRQEWCRRFESSQSRARKAPATSMALPSTPNASQSILSSKSAAALSTPPEAAKPVTPGK